MSGEAKATDSAPATAPGTNPPRTITPAREVLTLFTAGWLGGVGLMTLADAHAPLAARILGLAQLVIAAMWFAPKLRVAGYGAMLAVLLIAAVRIVIAGQLPGALIFYAAIVIYLAAESGVMRDAPRSS